MLDLDSVADELYGLSLEDFTAVRTASAKQARADGERQLAADIQALRKPTQAAWLLNQLVRAHRDEIDLLLDLGHELRDVMADVEGDALRQLTRQRYQLVSALVEQTRTLAVAHGRRMSDDVASAVRTTLEATLSDQAGAEALAAGQLTEPLAVSGFGASEAEPASHRPTQPRRRTPQPTPHTASVTDLAAERRRRKRDATAAEASQAVQSADQARAEADQSAEQLAAVKVQRHEAEEALEQARTQLEEAEQTLTQLRVTQAEARATADAADKAAAEAANAAEEAKRRLDALDD